MTRVINNVQIVRGGGGAGGGVITPGHDDKLKGPVLVSNTKYFC